MNTGKTLFAQLMDFLPWTTFTRIVDRYGGDHRVRTLSCAEQYRSMAFAQLTYRESLRDTVPDNVTLALLPPYSPELNPVERVWLYLRERFLSLRVLDDTEAIIDACCQAWIDLIAEPDRMRTLCAYPWIMKVIS